MTSTRRWRSPRGRCPTSARSSLHEAPRPREPLAASCRLLREGGVDATHVLDEGLGGTSDIEVGERAIAEGRTVVSADSDFATLLALSRGTAPSLVLLRSGDQLVPAAQAALLLANLPSLDADLASGVVVSLSARHVRVRRLPLT